MIKIICCDVDGTLVTDDKKITEENKVAIRRAVEEFGVRFVIVSGRPLTGIREFYKELGITGPVSGFNGCALYDENDNIVVDHRIEKALSDKVIDLAKSMNIQIIFFDDKRWIIETRDCYAYRKKKAIYRQECELFDIKSLKCSPNKLLAMFESKEEQNAFIAALKNAGLGEDTLTFYLGPDFVELMPFGVSKANGVKDLSSYYKVPIEQIMAIGDDLNDVEMLKAAGFGVAVANAYKPAKDVADYICDVDNNHSAVSNIIEKFIILPKRTE